MHLARYLTDLIFKVIISLCILFFYSVVWVIDFILLNTIAFRFKILEFPEIQFQIDTFAIGNQTGVMAKNVLKLNEEDKYRLLPVWHILPVERLPALQGSESETEYQR